MGDQAATPEERFAGAAGELLGTPGVTLVTGAGDPAGKFGKSPELRVGNRIFALLSRGRLVVKLPGRRVDQLVAAGQGRRFDPGHGRLMKEWLDVDPAAGAAWPELAREAMEFVASKR